MDYLKMLSSDPVLADACDRLCDFYLLEEMTERETEDGHLTYTLCGHAFAKDGSGGEYHLLEDGSIGYHGSEGQTGRLAENPDEFFSLLVNCICWHDYCEESRYSDPATLEQYGQQQRRILLEDIDADSWKRVADAWKILIADKLAPILERFRTAAQRQPLYRSIYHEDDGSLTQSDDLI